METYWNHNTAFHHELIADVKRRGGRVLDIGCGDGLLVEQLAPFSQYVVGIDTDPSAIATAKERLTTFSNISLETVDFLNMSVPSPEERFTTVICVATLHHMNLRNALSKIREVLAPGGRLIVIGLSANRSLADYVFSGILVLPVRIMERFHGGLHDPGVHTTPAKESLQEIKNVAEEILSEAQIKRRFYYRYSLSWYKPDKA